jgi:lactose/L-arabinose transport system substrate-binding protein
MKNSMWIFAGLLVLVVGVVAALSFVKNHPTTQPSDSETATVDGPLVNDDPNTLTIWSWNTAAKALQSLVPAFNEKYPDIKIRVVEIPYEDANKKFNLAISSGTGFPDIWDAEAKVSNQFIKSGALLDITDKAKKYKNEFSDYKWPEVMNNGRIYGLPWDDAPVAVFYRRDIFEEAGINPDDIKVWDDFIEQGKKLSKIVGPDGKPKHYMTFISKKSDVQDTFQVFLQQLGGSVYDEKGNVTFNNDKGLKSLQLMKKMLDSGIAADDIGWWTPEFFDSMKTGKVATYTQGVWLGGQLKELAPNTFGKWGVFPLPAVTPGGIRSAALGGSNLTIPVKSKNPEAAWKFIEFALANKDSQLKMYRDYNIFPALKAAYKDPTFDAPNPFFANQKTSSIFIETQKRLPASWHYGPYFSATNSITSSELVKALNGEKTPQEALNAAAKQVNELVKKNKNL